MPNHVRTVVKFKNLKKEEDKDLIIQMIGRELVEKDDMFSPDEKDYIIDFDKIIPEPKEKSECPIECLRTEDDHVGADPDKPWFNWYTWHCKYWGTKWGAYDGYTERGKTYIKFIFSTAWSVAEPVIEKLAILGYDIEVLYADEDWGNNCGKMEYNVNRCEWTYTSADELPNSTAFAKNLWEKY